MDNNLVHREAGLDRLNWYEPAFTHQNQYAHSPYCSLSISNGTEKENVNTNQESLGDYFPYS